MKRRNLIKGAVAAVVASIPDIPTFPKVELGIDDIGIPEDIAWGLYGLFVQRRLIASGAMADVQTVSNQELKDLGNEILREELQSRPLLGMYESLSAPADPRPYLIGLNARLVSGDEMQINDHVKTRIQGDSIGLYVSDNKIVNDHIRNNMMASHRLL